MRRAPPAGPSTRASGIETAADPSSTVAVDIGDPASLRRWAQALGLTPEVLESAVRAVGPWVDRIKDHLNAGAAQAQQDA